MRVLTVIHKGDRIAELGLLPFEAAKKSKLTMYPPSSSSLPEG